MGGITASFRLHHFDADNLKIGALREKEKNSAAVSDFSDAATLIMYCRPLGQDGYFVAVCKQELHAPVRINRYGFYYDDVRFGLHDLDGDGVPELICFTNGPDMASRFNYVYAWRNGKVTYLGDIGGRSYDFFYAPGSGYQGLYFQGGIPESRIESRENRRYGSYEKLLRDPKIRLVYVATLHPRHYKNNCCIL